MFCGLLDECRRRKRSEAEKKQKKRSAPAEISMLSGTTGISGGDIGCGSSLAATTIETDNIEDAAEADTLTKRRTPVLFSTNRGLYLRVARTTSPAFLESTSRSEHGRLSHLQLINSAFDINFCDLERWSTNRAHTFSLEDTFTITKLQTAKQESTSSPPSISTPPVALHAPRGTSNNGGSCFSSHFGNDSFMPAKRSVHFNNAFSRFESLNCA